MFSSRVVHRPSGAFLLRTSARDPERGNADTSAGPSRILGEDEIMPEKAQNKGRREEEQGGARRPGKSGRGFANMDEARQRAIASEGGRAAHEQGKAHEFTSEEAREAGRKGGQASGGARSRRKQQATLNPANEQPNPPAPAPQGEAMDSDQHAKVEPGQGI